MIADIRERTSLQTVEQRVIRQSGERLDFCTNRGVHWRQPIEQRSSYRSGWQWAAHRTRRDRALKELERHPCAAVGQPPLSRADLRSSANHAVALRVSESTSSPSAQSAGLAADRGARGLSRRALRYCAINTTVAVTRPASVRNPCSHANGGGSSGDDQPNWGPSPLAPIQSPISDSNDSK